MNKAMWNVGTGTQTVLKIMKNPQWIPVFVL